MKLRRKWLLRFALLATSLLAPVVLAEGVLRLFDSVDHTRFYPHYPDVVFPSAFPNESRAPGVTGVSYFSTNRYGTRGPAPAGEEVGILAVGGSTTICTLLDDSETWPMLLMKYLNEDAGRVAGGSVVAGDAKFAWVTNSGVDGKSSDHHLMHAKYLLPLIPEVDYLLLYAGLNDCGSWLYQEQFDPNFLDDERNWRQRCAESFRISPFNDAELPWYKNLALWKRASLLKARFRSKTYSVNRDAGVIEQDAELAWLGEVQKNRQEVGERAVHRAKRETLPIALDYYARNLNRIIALAREQDVEPIFMAQALQHSHLSEEEKKRLWMGRMDGGTAYAKQEEMFELVQKYNARAREVASAAHVRFIDLVALLGEQDAGYYFDSVHFNELGARVAARAIADELRGHLTHRRTRAKAP